MVMVYCVKCNQATHLAHAHNVYIYNPSFCLTVKSWYESTAFTICAYFDFAASINDKLIQHDTTNADTCNVPLLHRQIQILIQLVYP